MTNKKLKLAAMSVALTACVAAQPMAAHAVEGPDSVEDNAVPQAEPAPVEGKTAEGEVEGEEEKQEEFVPPENDEAKKDDQAPAFGPGTKTDDITIDYKPAEKPEEPGETDETENPDGTYVKGDVIDNSKKDEATGKDGKIGEATKEETPDSSSSTTVVDPDAEVKKGESVVGKDEDGNTTITTPTETTGTQTTTTTGTGKADSETTITDTEKGDKIDLNKELKNKDGEVDKPTWETKTDDKLGDYTVKEVEPSEDGNSKTLTLTKTDDSAPEKEMSAEDYKKISFGFRPDNRFFIFRDAAAKKTGFSFRIPFGQAAIHPIQLIHLLLSPVRILFLLIAPVGQASAHFPQPVQEAFAFGTTLRLPRRLYS